jgi:hypothetical protein
LQYFHAASGGLLASLPLELRLRGKSTTLSHRAAIYYVDLVARLGMSLAQVVAAGKALDDERREAGLNQSALDAAAKAGLAQGAFEESVEEGSAVVEEFYPDDHDRPVAGAETNTSLSDKLQRKAAQAASAGAR